MIQHEQIQHLAPTRREEKPEKLSIRSFEGLRGLSEVTRDWESVTEVMEKVDYFHRIEWFRSYAESLAEDPDDILVFVIYRDAKPAAVFPFARTTRRIFFLKNRVLGLPHHSHAPLADFIMAPNVDRESCFALLSDILFQQQEIAWDTIFLPRVLEHSVAGSAWTGDRGVSARAIIRSLEPCDVIPLKSYREMLGGLSSGMRSKIRRSRRNASQLDQFHYCCLTKFPDLERAYTEFLNLESGGWKGKDGQGTAIQLDQSHCLFYRLLLERFAVFGGAVIHLLRDGERSVSALLGLVSNDTFYGFKIAYDEEYRKLSPGNLLLDSVIEGYAESGTVRFINLISHADWQQSWKPSQLKTIEVTVFSQGFRSRMLHALQRLKNLIRSVRDTSRERLFVSERGKLRLRFLKDS